MLNASDALIAPVRLGMVKPSIYNQSSDALEVIERFLNGEKDLTTLLSLNKDLITINKRKKVCIFFFFINFCLYNLG